MEPRKKHGWPFWVAVVLIMLPVLYVASFGPACWWTAKPFTNSELTNVNNLHNKPLLLYWRLGKLSAGEGIMSQAVSWWIMLGVPRGKFVSVPTSANGLSGKLFRNEGDRPTP